MWRKRVCSILLSCILSISAVPFSGLAVYAQDAAEQDAEMITEVTTEEETAAEEAAYDAADGEEDLSFDVGEEDGAVLEADEEAQTSDASEAEDPSAAAPVEGISEAADPSEADPVEEISETADPSEADSAKGITDAADPSDTDPAEGISEAADPSAADPVEGISEAADPSAADPVEGITEAADPSAAEPVEEISEAADPSAADPVEGISDAADPSAADSIEEISETTDPSDAGSDGMLFDGEGAEQAAETVDAGPAGTLSFPEIAEDAEESDFTEAAAETVNGVDYGIILECKDGKGMAFPGQEVTLEATGWRHKDHVTTYDGFWYKWEIIEGNEEGYASFRDGIEGVPGDYPTATISFTGDPDPQIYDNDNVEFGGGILVKVTLYDDIDGSGNYVPVTEGTIDGVTLKDEYFEISPMKIDQIPVGESMQVPLAFRYYSYYFHGFRYGFDVSWSFEYDDAAIEVLDPQGNRIDNTGETRFYPAKDYENEEDIETITIRRIGAAGTSLRITAHFSYVDHNGTVHGGEYGYQEEYSISHMFYEVDDPSNSGQGSGEEDPDCRIRIDCPQNRVYSDGAAEAFLHVEGVPGEAGTDYQVRVEAGFRSREGFSDLFTQGVEYDFDGEKITFSGEKLKERGLQDETWFGLRAGVYSADGEDLLCEEHGDFQFVEARVEYDLEEDRELLPGWDGSVSGRRGVRVENSQYPDGQDMEYRILDARVVRDDPWEGENGPVVVDFHKDQNNHDESDYWWYYRVRHHGEAEIEVTYEDLDGREQSYTFVLRVGGDVYSVYMDSTGRERNAFPGGEIELYADGRHEYMDENGEQQSNADGLGYRWFFEEGADYAVIEVHQDDPSRATLKFNPLQAGEDWIDENVRVSVRVLDADGNETGACDTTHFHVRSEYEEVWPYMLDRDLDVGMSLENIPFEVRRYVMGQEGYEVLDDKYDVRYEWHYDRNILRITEERDGETAEIPDGETASGNTFTFTRLGDWDSDFNVRACWTDERGEERDVYSINYQLWNRDYNIWFEEHDLDCYTDASELPSLVLRTDNLGDGWRDRMDFEIMAGSWDNDEWGDVLDLSRYTVTEEGNKVIVTLSRNFLDSLEDYANIRVEARLYQKDAGMTDESTLRDCDAWFHIGLAREHYDLEDDRDMLPGWDGTINGVRRCHAENSEYPGGRDVDYYVTDVEIVRDEPLEGEDGPVIDDLHRDQNGDDASDYWWNYHVSHRGEAELKVTYEDIHGQPQSYHFVIHVGGDVYRAWMESVSGETIAFPGGEIELAVHADHEYCDEDGQQHNDTEGLDYRWVLVHGAEYAQIAVHDDDHSRATLKFHALPQGAGGIDQEVRVGVCVLDRDKNETGGRDSMSFFVRDEYTEVWPLQLDGDLDVGRSIENQKFEVRTYVMGHDGFADCGDRFQLSYEWHFDENALRITYKKDGEEVVVRDGEPVPADTFTFTRLKEWDTDFNVRAFWSNWNGGYEDCWSNGYHLKGKDYRIPFEDEDDEIRDDEEKTFAVNTDSLGNLDYTIRFIADFYIGEEDDPRNGREEDFVYLTEGVEYEVDPSGSSVTVNGDLVERALRRAGCTREEFYLGAFLSYQGEDHYYEFFRVGLHRTGKSIQNISAGDISMTMFDAPALKVEGAQGALTYASSNEKAVKVDGSGRLTPVAAGTSMISIKAAATGDYRPGVTKCQVTVKKLDLSGSAVKVTTNAPSAGYTYNKKTQKPSTVKVVYTNSEKKAVTLTAGTDYSVSWPAAKDLVNAGTKTITIKAKGAKTTGTAKGTYKINKAKQTITCTPSAVAAGKTATYAVKLTDTAAKLTCAPKTAADKAFATVSKTDNTAKKITVKGVKAGAAKLTIKAAATTNYAAASRDITVNVVPAATTKLTAENLATGIKLTWAKVAGASGYYVYRDGTKIATISKAATVTYTDTKANTNGTKYVFKIVAYVTLNKKAVASTLSKSLTTCRVAGSAISSAVNSDAGKMTVKWAKNTKATGYQIQYSLNSNFASGNKTVTVNGASTVNRVIAGLTKGRTYYIRLRCCKKVGSTTYNSAWSAKKTLKVTK